MLYSGDREGEIRLEVSVALKRAVGFWFVRSERQTERFLSSEAVESAALALEGVDDVHGGDRLSLGVLAVRDGVTDHVLKEHLEDTTGLLVDEAGDTLHSTTTSQTADRGLGDALDVVTQHLAMALGASLSESLASLSTSGHSCTLDCSSEMPDPSQGLAYIPSSPSLPRPDTIPGASSASRFGALSG